MPNYNRVWASSAQAPDDIAEPDAGAVESGHGTVSPPRHNWENWLKNQIVKGLQQLQREAALHYNAAVPYGRGVTVRYGSDSYLSLEDGNQGNQPDTSPSVWRKLPEGGVGVFAGSVAGLEEVLDDRPGIYLQEVVGTSNDVVTAPSAFMIDTGLEATITPRRIGSVIEAVAYAPGASVQVKEGENEARRVARFRLVDGSEIGRASCRLYGQVVSSDAEPWAETIFSPNVHGRFTVTSLEPMTVRLQFATSNERTSARVGGSGPMTMTLREIAQ